MEKLKQPIKNIDKQYFINYLNQLYSDHGKVTRTLIDEHCPFSSDSVKRKFGSLTNALLEAEIPLKQGQRKMVSKEEITKEILRLADEFKYVSKPIMEHYSSYSPKIVQRIWGSFDNMYKELKINRHASGYIPTDTELIQELKDLYKEYGALTVDIFNKYSKYSKFVFYNRLGNLEDMHRLIGVNYSGQPFLKTAKWIINKYSQYLDEEPVFEARLDWLKNPNTGRYLPVDAYFPSSNIMIEYNGSQHYMIDGHYVKTEEELEHRQELDKIKYKLIKEHNINLIVIHYLDKVDDAFIEKSLGLRA